MRSEETRAAGRAFTVVLALVLALELLSCGMHSSPPPAPMQAAQSGPRIVFPDGFAVRVEIAADDATREQGLMYRDHLAPDEGMIFLFPQSGDYPFWMKNTLIPLDMIWIDDQRRIVHVAHDVPPCKADPCPTYPPGKTSLSVLEVAAGVAARHGLRDGQTLRFEELDHVVVH
ncbi:MAG TPA: DUF192 domain-containing protein [Thermoanaerobaculia bacterium]|nr:DUF192 domain-containing protein [Thermoanaerobaculia bacterium]